MNLRGIRAWGLAGAALLMIATCSRSADAQTQSSTVKSPATGKNLEVDVGGVFLAPTPMGSRNITLTAPDGSPLTLASTTTRIGASFGLEARLGFRATEWMRVEVVGGWSSVGFQTAVSGDTEGASSITASINASRFTAGGAATFRISQKGSHDIYAIAGASWMRELSELSASGVYDDGAIVDGGAGVKMWWHERPKSKVKRFGLRFEGRVGVRTGGMTLDDKSAHLVTTFVGSFIIGS